MLCVGYRTITYKELETEAQMIVLEKCRPAVGRVSTAATRLPLVLPALWSMYVYAWHLENGNMPLGVLVAAAWLWWLAFASIAMLFAQWCLRQVNDTYNLPAVQVANVALIVLNVVFGTWFYFIFN